VQVTVTTATCIADYMSWTEFSDAQKMELGKLYVPYLALGMFSSSLSPSPLNPTKLGISLFWWNVGWFCFVFLAVFMAVDMLGRLNGAVGRRPVDQGKKLK
jgi:hypothetical protein